jgi:uncharacterized protein YeaO (DUF488 family)
MLKLKRAYDEPAPQDGYRVLVDRLWPRGVKKEDARTDRWMKEIAPSDSLRKWYGHDPDKWDEFRDRYAAELEEKQEELDFLRKKSDGKTLTLVYGARDTEHSHAQALKEYLDDQS